MYNVEKFSQWTRKIINLTSDLLQFRAYPRDGGREVRALKVLVVFPMIIVFVVVVVGGRFRLCFLDQFIVMLTYIVIRR